MIYTISLKYDINRYFKTIFRRNGTAGPVGTRMGYMQVFIYVCLPFQIQSQQRFTSKKCVEDENNCPFVTDVNIAKDTLKLMISTENV